MKNIKSLSYSLSEREVSFIDKPSHGYNRKSWSERNLLNITIGINGYNRKNLSERNILNLIVEKVETR